MYIVFLVYLALVPSITGPAPDCALGANWGVWGGIVDCADDCKVAASWTIEDGDLWAAVASSFKNKNISFVLFKYMLFTAFVNLQYYYTWLDCLVNLISQNYK